ncbi:DNA topoisomerase IV subunit A [Maritalea sp.]|uniref:DNA topoisomerase IV subunit A n=1 Tax=Maritalea sp. TaxID=2003361 RepID=UPI003EF6F757
MGDQQPPDDSGQLPVLKLKSALEERYLNYALSTITQRALPDVRDGLKPVHRRILHAMRLLKLEPGQGYKKSSRVVGDVIGKFHPHGDQSVYDALVRLAQDFAVRYPLVDGQGNFGNIDGDSAAAMRYTEARLTDVAGRLLEGITEDAVDFRDTYDGEDNEPVVLPSNFPNLLANGSSGIAVGMATSIPPHNVAELCDAALHLIKTPNARTETLVNYVKGPDFPTGGILIDGEQSIINAYETGRGAFRCRARWESEDTGRGGYQIVITEVPYQVPKARLVEKIADLLIAKRLPLLRDVRDESDENVRLVLEPKSRVVDPIMLMESMFKLTDLESRISLNLNVLTKGAVPRVLGLGDTLREWLDHRKEVLVRRSNHRLRHIEHRLNVLSGYLIAYLNLDEVIRIIRQEDNAKSSLMAAFNLNDVQAEAILNMRLRALRKLEEVEIRTEFDGLTVEKAKIEELLGSDPQQWQVISTQIRDLRKAYGQDTKIGRRRTTFEDAPVANLEDIQTAMIEREPVTIILSEKGWIRALKGHTTDIEGLTFKTDDRIKTWAHAQTTDKLFLVATNGKVFTLLADKLPGGRGHGEPVRILIDLEESADILDLCVHVPGTKRMIASDIGNGFVVGEEAMIANTRKGKQVLNVTGEQEAKIFVKAEGDMVAVIGQNRKLLVFSRDQLPEMGRGKGVRLQRYKDGGVSDVKLFNAEDGLTWTDSSGRTYTKKGEELLEWQGERAQAGRQPPTGFPRNNKFKG